MDAWFYDGQTAVRRSVTVELGGDHLLIDRRMTIAFAELTRVGDTSRSVFGRTGDPGWRLGFDSPLPPDWQDALPSHVRYGSLIDRFGLAGTVAGGIVISALVLFGLWKTPEILAPLVPPSWERKLGDAIVGDLGGQACVAPAGQKILDDLARRLSEADRPMRVRVVNIGIPNAVALPGGQIALFDGILAQAKSPDEIAGVLAHEIGHVEHRDVMAGLIRQFGLGLVLGGSNRAGEYANLLLSAGYSRTAERSADQFAIARLSANRISTLPAADFFDRMSKLDSTGNAGVDSAIGWLSSHPISRERRDYFRAADKRIDNQRPAMSAADWNTVRAICERQKESEEDDE